MLVLVEEVWPLYQLLKEVWPLTVSLSEGVAASLHFCVLIKGVWPVYLLLLVLEVWPLEPAYASVRGVVSAPLRSSKEGVASIHYSVG